MTTGIGNRDSGSVAARGTITQSGERPAVRGPSAPAPERAPATTAGFSGTCENTSLADWIQLIEMGRRDAILVVRSPDLREGRLWCKAGEVIDARWEAFTGEEAVYRILSFESGKVTVEFGAFERPRTIHTSTTGLLLHAAFRKDTGASTAPHALPTPPPPAPETPPPAAGRRRLLGIAAASAAALVTFWLASRSGPESPPRAPAVASQTLAPPAPEDFPLHVEAQPDEAEIRLDGKVVARRTLSTRLPRDGQVHEMVIAAPGYVPELVTFRDQAPIERVILEPVTPMPPAEPQRTRAEEAPASRGRRSPATRTASDPAAFNASPAPSSPPPVASAQARQPTSPAAIPAPSPQPRVQTIDDRQPWVQPIDDPQPRIQGIE